jgi:MFS family permease
METSGVGLVSFSTGGRQSWRQALRALRQRLWPAPASADEQNVRRLYIEVFWGQAHGVVAQFHAPYALRLGATNAEIGLLSSLPSLLALAFGMPAGYLFSRCRNPQAWLGATIFIHRFSLLLAAFIPWLSLGQPGAALVWLIVLFSVPGTFFSVGWNPMLAEVIPEMNRAHVFAVRNTLAAIALTGGLYLAGRWLAARPFPINYQIMYIVAFAGSVVSSLYIALVKPSSLTIPPATRLRLSPAALWAQALAATQKQPDFARITLNTFAHSVGLWLIGPVYVLYYVRTLGATDSWIALNLLLANLSPVVGYYVWQRAIARWGENRVLKWTISIVGFYPMLVGLTPSLTLILAWTALNGLIVPGLNLSHFNMLLKVSPPAEKANYLAAYVVIMNAGAFVMPLVGVYLAEQFGFAMLLVAGGALSLLGSSLFRWRALQTPDSLALSKSSVQA